MGRCYTLVCHLVGWGNLTSLSLRKVLICKLEVMLPPLHHSCEFYKRLGMDNAWHIFIHQIFFFQIACQLASQKLQVQTLTIFNQWLSMSCYQKHPVVANHISDKDVYPEHVKNYNSITKHNLKMGKGFEQTVLQRRNAHGQ